MVKTITVTDQAYEHLRALKKQDESFSQVIERIYSEKKPISLDEMVGTMDESEGRKLEQEIEKSRKSFGRKNQG